MLIQIGDELIKLGTLENKESHSCQQSTEKCLKGVSKMDNKGKCQKPENLKGKPGECSPEQIKNVMAMIKIIRVIRRRKRVKSEE